MKQEVNFQLEMKVNDMYRFLLRHAYIGVTGVINFLISGGAFILFIKGAGTSAFGNAMLLLISALFTIINPIYLYYKAAKQVKLTPMFQKPLNYKLNEDEIMVSQGEEELKISWEDVKKVVETNQDIYLYLSLTRAYILPKRVYQEQTEIVRDIMKKKVTNGHLKLKK